MQNYQEPASEVKVQVYILTGFLINSDYVSGFHPFRDLGTQRAEHKQHIRKWFLKSIPSSKFIFQIILKI